MNPYTKRVIEGGEEMIAAELMRLQDVILQERKVLDRLSLRFGSDAIEAARRALVKEQQS